MALGLQGQPKLASNDVTKKEDAVSQGQENTLDAIKKKLAEISGSDALLCKVD